MNKQEILEVLEKLDMHPSRKLGQNFLIDHNLLLAMVNDAMPESGENILEVGPGTGVLTEELLARGCNLTAVELDHRLAPFLREKFAKNKNFRLIEGDACRQDYDKIMGTQLYRCIANLPYSCSSVLIAHMLKMQNPPQELFILLQKEMADRLMAKPCCKSYGALSVQVQLKYNVSTIRKVPKDVFLPPPEVSSTFVRLKTNKLQIPSELHQNIVRIAKCGFSQRRKMFQKLLTKYYSKDKLIAVFSELKLKSNCRAESLTIAQFIELGKKLT